ncbi:hypothetical protein K8352_11320 [Flavobacteriaceae bacterium F89]|uniref:Uncharacterized protein n=1 Tax=Cerina litoralis TaxID=2874477 RepID=A0AAE3JNS6_9FLAO|nr:hypothetical protein [Cerina litoralis]MCG2461340.1 hypothetical protein [Cerina litoralis]
MSKPTLDIDKAAKKKKAKSLLMGSVIAIVIAVTPYIFYSYNWFPTTNKLDLFFFTFESKYQESISVVMWFFMAKFVPLLLLIMWFFTCKHWWYHVLLIPIAMFVFQIAALIQQERYLDEVEIYWLIPIMMVVTPFVYFIRIKLFDKHVLGIDLEAIDAELKVYKEKERLEKEKAKETENEKNDSREAIPFSSDRYAPHKQA